ncbi:Fpg/Nei family DNA glycosylase [Terracoccus luteus]|uniref:Formamidopyrimidine-DNA glycosylase n=1 Tax=Terracoccus luteus TaxID=53356 RepID=A0A839Q3T9_9MICO|nr:DNA-formamidopyrimidine glycosylase family protein [Terracoccus luteus]MBB2987301.1 formamidopyrimidine-DNA glycosylase [Terracoccus luteus]MCP2172952.1 formamidopyrimidine-DNA glycosylase [Terracoccus luteus]
MPELPEVESARAAIERAGLERRIADVDDADTYECRPHHPGEIRDALVGRSLTAAHRQGKSMWCDTSGTGRSQTPGPELGIHLGMSGRIVITPPTVADADADSVVARSTTGGDYQGTRSSKSVISPRNPAWNRFTLFFEDGGELRLFDKRRLGRVRLDPDRSDLGPDAQDITLAQFRQRIGKGKAPLKARLLDQSAIAGIGNLLADETLWQAHLSPLRPSGELDDDELAALRRALRTATRAAIKHGGVHTGTFIRHRSRDGHCPRCGAEVKRATVGSRTTYWCPDEQQ